MNDPEKRLSRLRQDVFDAVTALEAEVTKMCPGDHQPLQHRDAQPPWCQVCGRDAAGVMRRGTNGLKRKKIAAS